MIDVIIIGAGASGLMAARELSSKGFKICILEARNRIGGRINTINDNGQIHEAGAEFIHGKLETTLALMKAAGLDVTKTASNFYELSDGKWCKSENTFEYETLLLQKLKALKSDVSIAAFLDLEFSEDKYIGLRESLLQYVQGYYAADPERASAMTFLKEWQSEDEEQFRPTNGYGNLMQFLLDDCNRQSTSIELSTVVKLIEWRKNYVKVVDESGRIFEAKKAVIAIPLGVWQSDIKERAHISFTPALTSKVNAAKQLGFGDAIKVSVQFTSVFWEDLPTNESSEPRNNFGFVFAETPIGTWWSQNPRKIPLLIGWVAGPTSTELAKYDDDEIKQRAIESIATIFNVTIESIQKQLKAISIHRWSQDPFALGAYTYSTTATLQAQPILAEPLEDTLFFAGESLYIGTETGTVEAALISGQRAANEVLQSLNK